MLQALSSLSRFLPRGPVRLAASSAVFAVGLGAMPALADTMMQLPGSFTVTPTGAAAYTIPIDVPPGTAGMKPTLSLDYTSQGGNGIAGMGWTLGGLPSITRCPTTLATEGQVGTVNFTASDAFCLEGQKLIAVGATSTSNPHTYGASGTVYYTEIDGFSKVTSNGSAGTGPASFTVQTKTGQTMIFGGTSDSAPTVSNGSVRVWALSKVTDTEGNYLTISYSTKPTTFTKKALTPGSGEAPYPVEIDYTGNAAQGLSTYNQVLFSYVERAAGDVIDSFVGGTEVRTSFKLTDVETYALGALVSDYRINYITGTSAGQTELQSVVKCDAAAVIGGTCTPPVVSSGKITQNPSCVGSGDCLVPTTFAWQNGAQIPRFPQSGSSAGANYAVYTGNFSGSGRTDVMWVPLDTTDAVTDPKYGKASGGSLIFWIAAVDGGFHQVTGDSSPAGYLPQVADFDGDGYSDILWCTEDQNGYVAHGEQNQMPAQQFPIPQYSSKCSVLMNKGAGQNWTANGDFFSKGDQFDFTKNGYGAAGFALPYIGSFSVPGRSDILWDSVTTYYLGSGTDYWYAHTAQISQYKSSGHFYDQVEEKDLSTDFQEVLNFGTTTSALLFLPVDVDGDGRTDMLLMTIDTSLYSAHVNGVYLALNQTTMQSASGAASFSFSSNTLPSGQNGSGFTFALGDFNGDGKLDILWYPADQYGLASAEYTSTTSTYTAGQAVIWTGNGDGTFTTNNAVDSSGKALIPPAGTMPLVADFNGDGKSDVLWVTETETTQKGTTSTPILSMSKTSTIWLGTSANLGTAGQLYFNSVSYGHGQNGPWSILPGDYNGDGKADLLWVEVDPTTGFTSTSTSPAEYTSLSDGVPAALMSGFSAGLSASSQIQYATLSGAGSVYTPSTSAVNYPSVNVVGPFPVVSEVDADDGVGGSFDYSSTYSYGPGLSDLSGRGFLGFASMSVTDTQLNVTQTTTYATDFCRRGMALTSNKTLSGFAQPLNTTSNDLHCHTMATPVSAYPVYYPYISSTVASEWELHSTTTTPALKTTTTHNYYDETTPGSGASFTATYLEGNLTSSLTTVAEPSGKTFKTAATNSYSDNIGKWCLGRLMSSSVTSSVAMPSGTASPPSVTRTSSFNYDSASCLLIQEVKEPSVGTANSDPYGLWTESDYTRDGFGNIVQTDVHAWIQGAKDVRTTKTAFDSTYHAFPTSTTNALGYTTSYAYDARFGKVTETTDPNQMITNVAYDGLGRVSSAMAPHPFGIKGETVNTSYFQCIGLPSSGVADCPKYGAYVVQAQTLSRNGSAQIAPITNVYYDAMARKLATDIQSFDGSTFSRTAIGYDRFGRILYGTRPYFLNGTLPSLPTLSTDPKNCPTNTALVTVNCYDAIGRVITQYLPNGASTTTNFSGYQTDSATGLSGVQEIDVNGDGEYYTVLKDAMGHTIEVTDALNHSSTYTYDSVGNMLTVTDPASNVVTFTYDPVAGLRKIGMQDPNIPAVSSTLPSVSWTYDGLGEVLTETNSSGTTTFTYDAIGRMTRRVEPSLTSGWHYDNASGGPNNGPGVCIGLPDLINAGVSSKRYSYDGWCRQTAVTQTINGVTQTISTGYDDQSGKISTSTYPDGLQTQTDWNAQGYVSDTQVQKPGASSMSRFVTINAEADPTLRPTQFTSGDGVVSNWSFDPTTGLPTTIESTPTSGGDLQNYSYGYDNLGNLTSRQTRSANVPWYNTSYSYDKLNRLTQNVDSRDTGYAQAYEYDAIGNMTWRSDLGKMNYGQGSAGPHQLSSVTVDPASPYLSTLSTGPLKSYAHTSFNRVASVTLGNNTTPTLEYGYDETHQRVRQTLKTPAGVITSTIYYFRGPGVMLEEQVNGDGSIEWHDYIGTAAGLAGEYWSSNESGAPAPKTLYFYSDAQGTISAISGSTSEQDSYDPFGKQQNTNGSSDPGCSLPSGDAQSRGWIGEEKLPTGCLVNLNARLYDPLTAHFLGPDSKVGQPFSTQGWNRYSYAGNNPMSFSDPTGMCFLGCFWKGIFGDVAAIAAAIVLDQWVLPAVEVAADIEVTATTQTFINAGITGAAQGAISTGTLKGTLLSAASALTQAGAGYLGQNLAAGSFASFALHGTAGGLSSVLRGGQFPSGFLAAGFSDLAGTYLQIPGNGFASTVANATVNAVIGGLGSILGGGKFENGAVTATFQYLFSPSTIGAAIGDQSSSDGLGDILGKIWNLPNDAIGLTVGTFDIFGSFVISGSLPSISFGNDAFQISNLQIGPSGAITFGNVQLYTGTDWNGNSVGPDTPVPISQYSNLSGYAIGDHEESHSLQSEFLGPLFFPVYFLNGGISSSNPYETQADKFAKYGVSPYPWSSGQ